VPLSGEQAGSRVQTDPAGAWQEELDSEYGYAGTRWLDRPELRQVLDAGADMALLDEFSLEDLRAAVALNRAHPHGFR
jgi:hypothetical protein